MTKCLYLALRTQLRLKVLHQLSRVPRTTQSFPATRAKQVALEKEVHSHVPATVLPGLVQAQMERACHQPCCYWLEHTVAWHHCVLPCQSLFPCPELCATMTNQSPCMSSLLLIVILLAYFGLFCFVFILFLWTSPNTVQYYVLIFWQWLRPTRSMYSIFNPQMYFLFLALD